MKVTANPLGKAPKINVSKLNAGTMYRLGDNDPVAASGSPALEAGSYVFWMAPTGKKPATLTTPVTVS
jgi:hypothetical protein